MRNIHKSNKHKFPLQRKSHLKEDINNDLYSLKGGSLEQYNNYLFNGNNVWFVDFEEGDISHVANTENNIDLFVPKSDLEVLDTLQEGISSQIETGLDKWANSIRDRNRKANPLWNDYWEYWGEGDLGDEDLAQVEPSMMLLVNEEYPSADNSWKPLGKDNDTYILENASDPRLVLNFDKEDISPMFGKENKNVLKESINDDGVIVDEEIHNAYKDKYHTKNNNRYIIKGNRNNEFGIDAYGYSNGEVLQLGSSMEEVYDNFVTDVYKPYPKFTNLLDADEVLQNGKDQDFWYKLIGRSLSMESAPYISSLSSDTQEFLLNMANHLNNK